MMYVRFNKGPRPARRIGEAKYPNLWSHLCAAWNPEYVTPKVLPDFGAMKMNLALTNVGLVQSQFGQVLSFNGTTSTAIAPIDVPRFTGGARFHRLTGKGSGGDLGVTITISTWVAPADSTALAGLIKWGGKSNGSGGYPGSLYMNNDVSAAGQFSFCLYRINTGVEFTQNSPQSLYGDDEWCHLVTTLQCGTPPSLAATCKLYFNGVPVTVTTIGNWAVITPVIDTRSSGNGEPMMLGAGGAAAPTHRYEGLMGETLIWDRVLSPAEIVQLYRGASPLERKAPYPRKGSFRSFKARTRAFIVA